MNRRLITIVRNNEINSYLIKIFLNLLIFFFIRKVQLFPVIYLSIKLNNVQSMKEISKEKYIKKNTMKI